MTNTTPTQQLLMPELVDFDCDCGQRKHIDMSYKQALIFWDVEEGAILKEGDAFCHCEVEKMTFPLTAPTACRLLHRLVAEGAAATAHQPIAQWEEAPITDDPSPSLQ